jgi:hypothetical protein
MPPAVVYGPDGKPWHSWRVLLLPFLENVALYKQYDFSQPWDGPTNRKVLEQMPSVYRDPLNGPTKGPFTHYAAIVGERAAFSDKGMRMPDAKTVPLGTTAGQLRLTDFIDGTSNTIAVGPVGPERKIPWTKPEDVSAGPDLSVGGPKGLAAPIRAKGADGRETASAPVLFMDGSIKRLSTRIQKRVLDGLATRNGQEPINADEAYEDVKGSMERVPVLELIGQGASAKARVVEVPVSEVPPDQREEPREPPSSARVAPAKPTAPEGKKPEP